jgi:hypothetical protein
VNLASNLINEALPGNVLSSIRYLDLSFNDISRWRETYKYYDIDSIERVVPTAFVETPILYFGDVGSTSAVSEIPIRSRVVNLIGNKMDGHQTLVLSDSREMTAVSTIPQKTDICNEAHMIVSHEFYNSAWGPFLYFHLNASNLANNMCGGNDCRAGVKQFVSDQYLFCAPKKVDCVWPCLREENVKLATGDSILKWYAFSFFYFFIIISLIILLCNVCVLI